MPREMEAKALNTGRPTDLGSIPHDEPVCVLRARDLFAVEAMRAYVKKARASKGGAAEHLVPDEALLNSMSGHADRMARYACEHGGFKKADL